MRPLDEINVPDGWQGDPKFVERGMILVMLAVYHSRYGEEPTGGDARYEQWLTSNDQPYARSVKVGEEWMPLDKGWVEDPGTLMVDNRGANRRIANPTREQADDDSRKILEIGLHVKEEVVPVTPLIPKAMVVLPILDLSMFRVRSRSGICNVNYTVYPR